MNVDNYLLLSPLVANLCVKVPIVYFPFPLSYFWFCSFFNLVSLLYFFLTDKMNFDNHTLLSSLLANLCVSIFLKYFQIYKNIIFLKISHSLLIFFVGQNSLVQIRYLFPLPPTKEVLLYQVFAKLTSFLKIVSHYLL